MKNLFNNEDYKTMFKKAVNDVRSAVSWGQATDEVDYYLGTTLDKWAEKISRSFDLDFNYAYNLLYKEVIKNERV